MRPDSSVPLRRPLRRGNVCVADGYGIKIHVHRGQLVVEDGLGRNRRRRIYARATHRISRLVVIGKQGFITLEAIHWLSDLGISLLQLDRDGRILASSNSRSGDARLRRLQAAAATTAVGVELTRWLLAEKLARQASVLERLDPSTEHTDAFSSAQRRLQEAGSLEHLVYAERDAALAYWSSWSSVRVRFARADAVRVPEYWLQFGQRTSPLFSSPRLAINPANATLNYAYCVLQAETQNACLAVGLDPSLGIVHADYRARSSFALDLMEAVRPRVDSHVLDLLQSRTFSRRDFTETPHGNCRILAPLSHELASTAPQWAQAIAPVVEQACEQLAKSPVSRVARLGAPLTGSKRSKAQDSKRKRTRTSSATEPKPPPTCRRCGGPLPRRNRVYCDDCLPHYQREQYGQAFHGSGIRAIERAKAEGEDPTHGADAASRRAASNVERKREAREWDERYGKLTDLSAFRREILPLIQGVPLSRLQQATGLSLRYVSLIRRGQKTPHPRHWTALAETAGAWRELC
jgi:CRISPR-associated endonuclease Cas1